MKISLQVILERLNLKEHAASLKSPYNSVFEDIRLLSPDLKALEAGILYVGNCPPENGVIIEYNSGLCLLNSTGSCPCDVLVIRSDQSFLDLFNRISQIFFRLRTQFEQLTQAILQKKGFQKVIELAFDICGNPVYLVDSSFKVLGIYGPETMPEMSATWRRLLSDGYMPYDVVMKLIESNELQTMESGICADLILSNYFYIPFINYNIRYKGRIQGHFFVVGMFKKITPGDIELTNLVGRYLLDAIRSDPNFQATRGRYYEHFIIDMLEGKNIRAEYLADQVEALQLDLNDFFTIVKIKPQHHDELRNEQIARQLENFNGSKPVHYDDSIVGIFSGKQYQQRNLYEKLGQISSNLNCHIGISDEIQGFVNLPIQYLQASNAITMGRLMELPETIYSYQDVMRYYPLLFIQNKKDLISMCHPGVMILRSYDAEHDSKYIETLETYLKNERHSLPTATDLHIHRNTLTYRLEKIEALFHFNLDDAFERERIILTQNILFYLNHASFATE